jgi:hypothetical protein
MFHFFFSVWAIGLGIVTGILGAFAINAWRFKATIKESAAAFYAYAAYVVMMAAFALISGGFNAPASYIFGSIVVAGLLAFIESPSGDPIVSKKVIEASPVEVLWLGRLFVILGSRKEDSEGTVNSRE